MPNYTGEQIAAAALELPLDARARIAGALLDSLQGGGPDAAWLEELRWQLQDWHAGIIHEPIDDLLDDPSPVLVVPAAEKPFDAVKMMREIRDKMSREMEGMTREEELAYIKEGLRRSRNPGTGEQS